MRRWSVDTVLVVLVILAPVVAVIRILLCFDPFLRFGAIDVGLERRRLSCGEEIGRLAVTGTGQ